MTTLIGGPGDQILPGVNNEPNTLYGDAVELGGHGETGGNDTLIGGNNSTNTLYGMPKICSAPARAASTHS
jgi:hypothetical protein